MIKTAKSKKRVRKAELAALMSTLIVASEIQSVNTSFANDNTSIEYNFSDIINTDDTLAYENDSRRIVTSLDDFKVEEDTTAFVKRHIKNNNLVKSLKRKKGR